MRHTWRWFGPNDKVSLSDARQAGALGVVTALHHIPPGQVWTPEDVAARKSQIDASGLSWDVVESLPVSEEIRRAGPLRDAHITAWIASLAPIYDAGVRVICYNFMPVLDWTRTTLAAPQPSGARAMRFDLVDFAAFDTAILKRPGAANSYSAEIVQAAQARAAQMTEDDKSAVSANCLAGLPGAAEHWTLESFRTQLAAYSEIDADALRGNLLYFLKAVVPEAAALGIRLCAHPDDPPWPLLGLPRILSTEADYQWLVDAVPSPANGITFCTGSLGARGDNDLPGIVTRLGEHIHFFHLRNVKRETATIPCSFFEDDHLAGSTDMIAVIAAIVRQERKRAANGRADLEIPMRPDHGQDLLDDQARGAAPGYPAIGRLKGLAELRGVEAALRHSG